MSTIHNVVRTALDEAGYSEYLRHAEPVIEALQEREDAIVEALRDVAGANGLSASDADSILETVGLIEPAPEPTPESASGVLNDTESEGGLAEAVAYLTDVVQRLVNAARSRGIAV